MGPTNRKRLEERLKARGRGGRSIRLDRFFLITRIPSQKGQAQSRALCRVGVIPNMAQRAGSRGITKYTNFSFLDARRISQ